MKNILNVNKISLKPIFMSLAILFMAVVYLPISLNNFSEASYSSDHNIEAEEDENEILICRQGSPLVPKTLPKYGKFLLVTCGEVTRENIKAEKSRSKDEDEVEEEEEDMGDPSGIFIPENNKYCDEQSEKAWEEFYNTLFGDSKSKINDLCPSICDLV